jgi:hypothetical protein
MIKSLLIVAFCAGVILPPAVFAQETKTIQLRIAEGKTILATVDDRGPFPAEDARVKIEVAGILVRFREDRKEPQLVWNFSFRTKASQLVSGVKVDDVTEDPVAGLVSDGRPTLKENLWSGTAQPVPISKDTIPWLYDSKPMIKVFRFTVQYQDGSQAVLHQLAWYPASFKETVRAHADKLRVGG